MHAEQYTQERLQCYDRCTTGCLLDYVYFKDYFKMVAIDLSKHQAVDAGPTAIEQNNFTGNLGQAGETAMFLSIEEAKEIKNYESM